MQKIQNNLNEMIIEGTPDDIRLRYAGLKEYAQKADFGKLDQSIVVIDTETTGVSFNTDQLTQIAAARLTRGQIEEWFVTFVNPGKPIPEDIVHLTNISDADVADAPTPDEALAQLVEFVGDSPLVAHNAAFDRHFTAEHYTAGRPLAENWWIDSLDLARIALPRLKSHRLIDLVHAFDTPVSTHRADADVEALCAVYRILLAAVCAMPKDLTQYIGDLVSPAEWETGKVFAYISQMQAALDQAENGEVGPVVRQYPFSLRAMRSIRFRGVPEQTTGLQRNAGHIVDAQGLLVNSVGEGGGAPLEFPTPEDIEEAFSEDGLVGHLYESYEPRHEQLVMADQVLRSMATSTNLVVEAGTGVGKSMAYLVPAAMTSLRNNVPVGVATKTNALLDQIVYKELPLLDEAIQAAGGKKLHYAALKGFSHYPCLFKVGKLLDDGAQLRLFNNKECSQAPSIAALLSYIEQTEYDDIDSLKMDYRAVPRASVTTTSRECLRRKCPFYGRYCYVHGARRQAEGANIVVTNHSLLFCDLAADGGLLPPARFWVVDEAHGAEAEVRRALATHFEAANLYRVASRLDSEDPRRNVFLRAERQSSFDGESQAESSTLFFSLTAKCRAAGKAFSQVSFDLIGQMKDLIKCEKTPGTKGYETVELWINDEVREMPVFKRFVGAALNFNEVADRLLNASTDLVAFLEGVDGMDDVQRELSVVVMDVKELRQAMDLIITTNNPDPGYVYSATLNRKSDRMVEVLNAELVDVGDLLNATLYERTDSVIFASATIAIGDDFTSFNNALGLDRSEASRTYECMLGSSYDFDTNMTVFVIKDMPEPNNPRYLHELQKLLIKAHVAQNGSMLSLFTNRKEMEACFGVVNDSLKLHDLRLVCQKWGVSTKTLRDDFLKDEHLSLFALKSFWEGFDAPGSTLRGVIIPKLPFAKPSDPLSRERDLRDDNAWSHYSLPQAVIEVKQAAGRLIRSSTDKGVLILADSRLVSKRYGKVFLRSLPSKNVRICTADEAIEAMKQMAE